MKFGISTEDHDKVCSVFSNFKSITRVVVYGSRAKGTYKPGSDIDLCITEGFVDFHQMNQLKNQLDDLNLPYTIDLSNFEELTNSELKSHIERVGLVFYPAN